MSYPGSLLNNANNKHYTKSSFFDLVSDWFDWQSNGIFDRQCKFGALMSYIYGSDYMSGSTEGLPTGITVILALSQNVDSCSTSQ
jgi:hypothetical protein